MSIKYWIDLGCEPRSEAGEDTLASLVFFRALRDDARRQFRLRGIGDETRMRIRERLGHGEDADDRVITVAELSARVAPLEALSFHCAGCPASIDGLEFGCISNVAFPISAKAEEWLAGLAPAGSHRRMLLEEAIAEYGYGEGTRFAEWRALGLLERGLAAHPEGGGPAHSDAIMHMLFLFGEVTPQHALGVLMRLGGLRTTDGMAGDDVVRAIERAVSGDEPPDQMPQLEFALLPEAGDDASILEIRRFLYALFIALSLEARVAVRV
jgi:hypothetical protein